MLLLAKRSCPFKPIFVMTYANGTVATISWHQFYTHVDEYGRRAQSTLHGAEKDNVEVYSLIV